MTSTRNSVERARVAACEPFDAKEWLLRQCQAIGMEVSEWQDGLLIIYGESPHDERLFLECWANLSPGANAAILDVLRRKKLH